MLIGLATLGLQVYIRQRLGGITGDILGATNKLTEALVLLLATQEAAQHAPPCQL